jgi:hypothetical protein
MSVNEKQKHMKRGANPVQIPEEGQTIGILRNRDNFERDEGRPPAKKPRVVENPTRRFGDVRSKVSEVSRNGKIVLVDDNDLLNGVDGYNVFNVGHITFKDYAKGA